MNKDNYIYKTAQVASACKHILRLRQMQKGAFWPFTYDTKAREKEIQDLMREMDAEDTAPAKPAKRLSKEERLGIQLLFDNIAQGKGNSVVTHTFK